MVQAPETTWQHGMYSDKGAAFQGQAVRTSVIETGTKLYISNLDYGVSNDDVKVKSFLLFSYLIFNIRFSGLFRSVISLSVILI